MEKLIQEINRNKKLMSIISEAMLNAPINGELTVTSDFGEKRAYETHPGVDLRAASGTEVLAPADGKIVNTNPDSRRCGGLLDIEMANGFWGRFCHLKKIYKQVGDVVKKGDVLALSGGDASDIGHGNSKTAHLHFSLKKDGQNVDPMNYIGKNIAPVTKSIQPIENPKNDEEVSLNNLLNLTIGGVKVADLAGETLSGVSPTEDFVSTIMKFASLFT